MPLPHLPCKPSIPIPEAFKDLVAHFRLHIDDYKSGHYNETRLRRYAGLGVNELFVECIKEKEGELRLEGLLGICVIDF